MDSKRVVLASLIISAGIALMGYFIKCGIVETEESKRMVAVKGLSERSVEADNVIMPLKYDLIGNDLAQLYSQMESKNEIIIKFLKEHGIASADISVPMPEVFDAYADRYSNSTTVRARYNVTSVVTVTSKDVAKVREAISDLSELIKRGIALKSERYGSDQIIFSYNSLNEIKPQMIEEATKSARQSAEKFAKDSQSKLGKIKYANQGQFSISTPDVNAPHIKMVRVVTTVNYYLKD